MRKLTPAGMLLKARSRATRQPPMSEPNIGMRLKMPVTRPNGNARPGARPKMTESKKTATAVQQALMRETEMALVTYLAMMSAMRSATLEMRLASGLARKWRQKRLRMPGPSVSIKRESTRTRITAVIRLAIVPMEAARKLLRLSTMPPVKVLRVETIWACVSSMPRLLAKLSMGVPSPILSLISCGKLLANLTDSLMMVGPTMATTPMRKPTTRT